MAIAEYITKVELDALEKRLLKDISDMEQRLLKDNREQANRVIEAISHGTNPNF
jgi:hypothetical protein